MRRLLSTISIIIVLAACQKAHNVETITEITKEAVTDPCVSQEILEKEISSDPSRQVFLNQLEEKTANYPGRGFTDRAPGKLYLPVVIHIVMTDPSIITDATILSQLNVWNKDFNKANDELSNPSVYLAGYQLSKVANCQIEFYITDVKRVVTSVTEFPQGNAMKSSATGGSDPVDPATKLNVWVCNTPSGLSWGHFPGAPLETDGIVIDYMFFGTTWPLHGGNYKGRIGTHEVGHWLNLRHIWGDANCGDDLVKDTPVHTTYNTGCPAIGLKSTCKSKPLMLWMNYMDYSYGRCRYMFTTGQKQRMDAAIDYARKGWFSATKVYPQLSL